MQLVILVYKLVGRIIGKLIISYLKLFRISVLNSLFSICDLVFNFSMLLSVRIVC